MTSIVYTRLVIYIVDIHNIGFHPGRRILIIYGSLYLSPAKILLFCHFDGCVLDAGAKVGVKIDRHAISSRDDTLRLSSI